jgi:hypothetical protein
MNKKSSPKEPNIHFVGAKDGFQPLSSITNGDAVIKLPKTQSKPFFHKDAKTIVRLYGWLYKQVVKK